MGSFPFPTPGTFVLLPSYGRTLPHSGAVSRSRCYCSKSCFQFFLSASRNLLADAVNGIMSSMCAARLCNSTSASSDSSSDCQRVVCTSCRPAVRTYFVLLNVCIHCAYQCIELQCVDCIQYVQTLQECHLSTVIGRSIATLHPINIKGKAYMHIHT